MADRGEVFIKVPPAEPQEPTAEDIRLALDKIAHWPGPITADTAHEMRMLARRVLDGWKHPFGPPENPDASDS